MTANRSASERSRDGFQLDREPAHGIGPLAGLSSLTAGIYGLGGLGVVSLTRAFSRALQLRFARTAATELRGIAQRRAPVRAVVRAGPSVRSASAPAAATNLVIVLEAGEALRALPHATAGVTFLLSDLTVAPSSRHVATAPDAVQIRAQLEQLGARVVPLAAHAWLAARKLADHQVSSIAYGALIGLLDLPAGPCEALLLDASDGAQHRDIHAAFEWGLTQTRASADRPRPVVQVAPIAVDKRVRQFTPLSAPAGA
jgi:Pyruvate/2-oxoacid:ferredoxin oxidoreductase gamma subunit